MATRAMILIFVLYCAGCVGWSPDITITDTYTRSGGPAPKILPELNACSAAASVIGRPYAAEHKAESVYTLSKKRGGKPKEYLSIKKETKCHW